MWSIIHSIAEILSIKGDKPQIYWRGEKKTDENGGPKSVEHSRKWKTQLLVRQRQRQGRHFSVQCECFCHHDRTGQSVGRHLTDMNRWHDVKPNH